jgi:hypothetical protein
MYRLAIALALLASVAAGCGGGSDSDNAGPNPAASSVAGASKHAAPAKAAEPTSKTKTAKDAEEGSAKKKSESKQSGDDAATDPQEASKQPSAADREKLIRGAVVATLVRFNLRLADLAVKNRGSSITVFVTRASACNAVAKDEPNMVLLIKDGAPFVKSARFEVAGTDQQLGYYVLSCKREKMPSGPGRVVFQHTGVSGPYTSPVFTITKKHWALEWENAGASMACIVLAVGGESKGGYFKPVGAQKKSTGRNEYTGTGKFRLMIDGAALWKVRVKEIR